MRDRSKEQVGGMCAVGEFSKDDEAVCRRSAVRCARRRGGATRFRRDSTEPSCCFAMTVMLGLDGLSKRCATERKESPLRPGVKTGENDRTASFTARTSVSAARVVPLRQAGRTGVEKASGAPAKKLVISNDRGEGSSSSLCGV